MPDLVPRPRRSALEWVDRWLLQIVSALVVVVWICSDAVGLVLSEGTKAALGAFVAYTLLRTKSDERWRKWEADAEELDRLKGMVAELDKAAPGSPRALKAREALVASTLRAREMRRSDDGDT